MQNILYCNYVLSIVINIQNTTIFEPLILTGFYTSLQKITRSEQNKFNPRNGSQDTLPRIITILKRRIACIISLYELIPPVIIAY